MGWAHGFGFSPRTRVKRPIGYGVNAKCDEPRCRTRIDRGLSYLCGRLHGDDGIGCGGYYCGEHLRYAPPKGEEVGGTTSGYLCPSCLKRRSADERRGGA